jgi:hypothetical protein
MQRLSHSKIDALIVDCDLNGTSQLFHELNTPGRQFNTVPLVVMGKHQDMAILNQTGALFAFEKPISVEQAVRTLSAARCMILDGRLRYHRIGVEIPVSLKPKGNKKLDAHLVNVSQGGMRISTDQALDSGGLQISCELPGAKSELKAQAEVVWQDKSGNVGIRFVNVPAQQQRALELWLAQQFLAN